MDQLLAGSIARIRGRPRSKTSRAWAALHRDGDDRWVVRQGGPDRLWDRVEEHVARWRRDGSPDLGRFRITVTPETQTITWPN
ncbi:hypothetical protein [Streptomyces vietnamensis]|uniref:Uncharacterized protein n=1 Tax=Streptomyces vietnamensis TaxID=362257 RepID=A0A0B5HXA6_9ACTN|nr:hypothetical protein [Streptomyces vietnamensis]AJF66575.1 hypothetical protein SVTN_21545 [Streptomyces vietnamensis]